MLASGDDKTVPEQGRVTMSLADSGVTIHPPVQQELSRICASASSNLAEESRDPQDMREARSLPKMKPHQKESSVMLEFSGM